uniref:Antitoxin SocA-like Panacea domain-containing protein n=1 Tax=Candidatus Kentrum sp. FM TaxID=2126340 RepID=A0A450WK15_9GAMM|nr:MAG: Protein of unknown function (DUF4065) [Candidatus Kentron sp. FM]VFJ72756.1 MAG: Protein of unknown function (DUF4065) [Candidatus Kentron sp. FM]VFK17359.1 MAG: Protein of unknown function (DUF4065) [Candidatus Kentron sp. FM]
MIEHNKKLSAAVHYICAECSDPGLLGSTKLNKILLFSDIQSYIKTGETITGAIYEKMQFGPVPVGIKQSTNYLEHNGKILIRKADPPKRYHDEYISLEDPDGDISVDGLDILLEQANYIMHNYTAREISDLSHNIVWESAAMGEEIPMSAYLVCIEGKIEDKDIEWANGVVSKMSKGI